jgi:PilZ domain
MSTLPVQLERRAAQRFDFHLPVSIKVGDAQQSGFTQDISARGAFFYVEYPLTEGSRLELTLTMPSEITLTGRMLVRCRGKVLRVMRQSTGTKVGVAVNLEGYEFLANGDAGRDEEGDFERISGLHPHSIVPQV